MLHTETYLLLHILLAFFNSLPRRADSTRQYQL